ncbi:conserved membrane hypothetical protein [Burkholderiales bacterium 8X]|nr:conserved membrane hypothetical protein [Burkholderiales bacterium 8X]
MPTLRRFFRAFAAALLVPLLLFEEWGWEPLAALAARLARLPIWARVEQWLRSLPPWGAVLVFFVPVLMLLPVKLLGLFLLGRGHPGAALGLLVGAKLVGTAIVARLFQLVEPALMRIPLFARWYPRWKGWKDEVLAVVRASAAWRVAGAIRARARRWWRRQVGPN